MNKPEDFPLGTRVHVGESPVVYFVSSRPLQFSGATCVYLKDERKCRYRGCYNINDLGIIMEDKQHGR